MRPVPADREWSRFPASAAGSETRRRRLAGALMGGGLGLAYEGATSGGECPRHARHPLPRTAIGTVGRRSAPRSLGNCARFVAAGFERMTTAFLPGPLHTFCVRQAQGGKLQESGRQWAGAM